MTPAKISAGARLLSGKIQLKPQLCKFLGIPLVSPRGEIPILISKFLKLHHPQSPGIKKDKIWEENLKAILHGKDGVGMSEINKILSPQFNDPSLRNKERERQKDISRGSRCRLASGGLTADEAKFDSLLPFWVVFSELINANARLERVAFRVSIV